jgi:hypothetical protein
MVLVNFISFCCCRNHILDLLFKFRISFQLLLTYLRRYTVKKGYQLFPARESLVSDIPPVDGKIGNIFLQCIHEISSNIGSKGGKVYRTICFMILLMFSHLSREFCIPFRGGGGGVRGDFIP